MTWLWSDGFDASDYAVKMPAAGVFSTPAGRYGVGLAAQPQNNFKVPLFTASSKIFCGFAWKPTSATAFFTIYGDAGATAHLTLAVATNGVVTLARGGSSIATSAAVATLVHASALWTYLEISATIHDSTGNVVVKADGVEIINFTGDTKNAGTATTIDQVGFTSNTGYVDDLYVCNDSGSAPWNTFLGEIRIATSVGTGAGSSTGWTPDSGSNYARVNELPYSTANYVGTNAATPGTRDLYAVTDLPSNAGTVLGVAVNVIAKKTDAGAASAKAAIRTGSTNYAGSAFSPTTSDIAYQSRWEVSPNTSAAWAVANVNSIEAGVETA
jgi:hypothetical protein